MDVNELLDILYTVPFNKLTNGTIQCRINSYTNIASTLPRIDIDFMLGNTCISFVRVYGDRTLVPAIAGILKTKPRHEEYTTAMEQVIAYLEIIGFKNVC